MLRNGRLVWSGLLLATLGLLLSVLPLQAEPAVWQNPVGGQAVALGEIPPFQPGDVVCFVGDSIPHWDGSYHRYIEDFWLTRYPRVRVRYVNGGIAGNSAAYVLNRFDYDVAAWQPTYLTINLGMNDVGWQQYEPGVDPAVREQKIKEYADRYRQDMGTLLDRMVALKPRTVVVLPP